MKKFRIEYQGQTIRGYIEDKNFWFDLSETCGIFRFSKESILQTCDKDEKKRFPYNDGKQLRYKTYINQYALGRAILRGRDKKCKEAHEWVCSWLMPSIVDYYAFGFFTVMEHGASRQLKQIVSECNELCEIIENSEMTKEIAMQRTQDLQRLETLRERTAQILEKIEQGYAL